MEEKDTRPVMVSIRCTVYNHEPYLRDCLNGFVMQKTNFRFEAIVHDDASTDGSAAIIREYAEKYPDIIKPIYQTENQYSKGKDSHMGRDMDAAMSPDSKYIALCEGDDYWIDPLKLQKQVDFLEANKEYVLTFGDVKNYYADSNRFGEKQSQIFGHSNSQVEQLNKEELFRWIITNMIRIQTLTVLYRRDLIHQIKPNAKKFLMGDTPLWLDLSQMGKFKYISNLMGVYNIHSGSACRMDKRRNLIFSLSIWEMSVYYCNKYGYTIPHYVKRNFNETCESLIINNYPFKCLYSPFRLSVFTNTHFKWLRNKFYGNIVTCYRKVFSRPCAAIKYRCLNGINKIRSRNISSKL